MTISILRTAEHWWFETASGAVPIRTDASTTAQLLESIDSLSEQLGAPAESPTSVNDLALVSPVTTPCRVVAQMTNFASHARDAGLDPDNLAPTFFRKTSGSICGPFDDIVKPAHTSLLDYEVEIGIVFRRAVPVGTVITAENIGHYAAGLVVTNDVSARDIQLPKTQYYEAKSYPTFTPIGPRLVLLDHADWARFDALRLQLWVNGQIRQDGLVAGDMISSPVQALNTLTGFQRLDPGDVLMTGTPVGTALSAPPKPIEIIGSLLPPQVKWKAFFKRQAANPKYLQDGDVVEVRIATDDAAIDLGRQRSTVRFAR
ncbi:fumarylacetoacetate hydrolase family protein [Nocardia sp. NPDC047038]|uniref:fumarylacetoacetate hydrolase family protein n=1 Tax=Nocardia sp. NPDC047038 TaxID=3154338 RepID=UPI0033C5ECDD